MSIRALSDLLEDLKSSFDGRENVSIGQLLEAFHERGFGFFLFVFALPAALPLPGLGVNVIIAAPLLLLTAQQIAGRHTIWLPEKTKGKTFEGKSLDSVIEKAAPWIRRIEFFLSPRLAFITQGVFSHLIGVFGFIMACSILVPLPLTNTAPAIGICLMSIGVLTRDGLAVIVGAIWGLAWVAMLVTVTAIFGMGGFDLVKDTIKSFF